MSKLTFIVITGILFLVISFAIEVYAENKARRENGLHGELVALVLILCWASFLIGLLFAIYLVD